MDELNLDPHIPQTPEVPSPEEIDVTKPLVPRRRRRKSKQQIFKETYLPFIILGVSVVLSLSFILGSVSRGRDRAAAKAKEERITQLLKDEAESLKSRAAAMAAEYDYENAMKTLASYSGGLAGHQELMDLYILLCMSDYNLMTGWFKSGSKHSPCISFD